LTIPDESLGHKNAINRSDKESGEVTQQDEFEAQLTSILTQLSPVEVT